MGYFSNALQASKYVSFGRTFLLAGVVTTHARSLGQVFRCVSDHGLPSSSMAASDPANVNVIAVSCSLRATRKAGLYKQTGIQRANSKG